MPAYTQQEIEDAVQLMHQYDPKGENVVNSILSPSHVLDFIGMNKLVEKLLSLPKTSMQERFAIAKAQKIITEVYQNGDPQSKEVLRQAALNVRERGNASAHVKEVEMTEMTAKRPRASSNSTDSMSSRSSMNSQSSEDEDEAKAEVKRSPIQGDAEGIAHTGAAAPHDKNPTRYNLYEGNVNAQKKIQQRFNKHFRWADYKVGGRVNVEGITVQNYYEGTPKEIRGVKIPYAVGRGNAKKITDGYIGVDDKGRVSVSPELLNKALTSNHETKCLARAMVGAYKLSQPKRTWGEFLAGQPQKKLPPFNVGAIQDPILRRQVINDCKSARPPIPVNYGNRADLLKNDQSFARKAASAFDCSLGKLGRFLGIPPLGIVRAGVFRNSIQNEKGEKEIIQTGQRLR